MTVAFSLRSSACSRSPEKMGMNRRDLLKLSSCAVAAASAPALSQTVPAPPQAPVPSGPVPRWDPVELSFSDPTAGNPFLDVFALPEGKTCTAEYIDTLELTRTPLPGEYSGKAEVKLPGTPWGSLWFCEKNVA
jgi:hypothetical protein